MRANESLRPDSIQDRYAKSTVAGKDPWMALSVGMFFGPFGVGIYLESWIDFLACVGLVVVGTMAFGGDHALMFWIMCVL